MTQITSWNIHFHSVHSDYNILIQSYSEKSSANIYTVTLTGSLSENQFSENYVCEDYFKTNTMHNNLTLILLILLILWY